MPTGAGAPAASEPAIAYTSVTRLGVSTTTFSCGRNLGICNYLVLTSLCQDKLLDNGVKEKTCRYTLPVPPFRLLPGQRTTVSNLPSDLLYTMKVNAAPTPADVVNSPVPTSRGQVSASMTSKAAGISARKAVRWATRIDRS